MWISEKGLGCREIADRMLDYHTDLFPKEVLFISGNGFPIYCTLSMQLSLVLGYFGEAKLFTEPKFDLSSV